MEKFIHFTEHYNTFNPTCDPEEAPGISVDYGGLFVYRYPETEEDFNTLWKAWGYRDAVEVWADGAIFNDDSPSEEGDIFAEYVIPFDAFNTMRWYRVDC